MFGTVTEAASVVVAPMVSAWTETSSWLKLVNIAKTNTSINAITACITMVRYKKVDEVNCLVARNWTIVLQNSLVMLPTSSGVPPRSAPSTSICVERLTNSLPVSVLNFSQHLSIGISAFNLTPNRSMWYPKLPIEAISILLIASDNVTPVDPAIFPRVLIKVGISWSSLSTLLWSIIWKYAVGIIEMPRHAKTMAVPGKRL